MHRLSFLLIVLLAVAGAGFAQSNGSTPSAPPASSGTALTGTFVDGTFINTAGPQGAVSPEIHLETVMPPAGATSNMAGAPAGVSSSPNNGGTISAPTTYTVPVVENAPQPMVDSNAAVSDNSRTYVPAEDVHGMVYAGAVYSGDAGSKNSVSAGAVEDNRSLAEVAAQYKRGRSTQNARRTFTNEDIARLNARNDVNVMGANQNQSLPQSEGVEPAPAANKNQKRSPFTPKN